jgi:hypothetical protein
MGFSGFGVLFIALWLLTGPVAAAYLIWALAHRHDAPNDRA